MSAFVHALCRPFCSVPGFALSLLLAALAYPTFTVLVDAWQHHPDYSHGWLLLPATLWLFLRSPASLPAQTTQLSLGTMTILAGGILHLLAIVIPWPLVDYAGWVLLVRGVILSTAGRDAAHRAWPALCFAVFMFPLPTVWLNTLSMQLQHVIAWLADWGLSLFWIIHRQGHLLHVAGLEEPLSVAVECSGVRQLLVFLSLACWLSFYLHGSVYRKGLFILSAIPLAIIANVLRVFLLAISARLFGSASIQGILHDLPLLVTLPLGSLLLWLLFQRLQHTTLPPINPEIEPVSHPQSTSVTRNHWLVAVPLLLLVCLQLLLCRHLTSAASTADLHSFQLDNLPWQLGTWKGQVHPEADLVRKQVDFADALTVRSYQDDQGHAVAVYIVFSATGRDRLHHPEICLRDAGGAVELKDDRAIIALDSSRQRQAERFRYQRSRTQRTLVYYWHYTVLPTSTSSFLQRIHQQQSDHWPGITVQVQTNLSDAGSWQAIEQTLLPELDRWFQAHLPVGTRMGSNRLPVRLVHE